MKQEYLEYMSKQERHVFQYKVAPNTIHKDVLFRAGSDFVLRRCPKVRIEMKAFHEDIEGDHFAMHNIIK